MRHLTLLLCLLQAATPATLKSQTAADTNSARHHSEQHSAQPAAFIVPSVLITSGILGHTLPSLHQLDIDLHNEVISWQLPLNHIDNTLQYLPVASLFALKICGLRSQHTYRDLIPLAAESYLIGATVVLTTKQIIDIQRPDGSAFNSFPSGHTFTAFAGAELLRREYGSDYPIIAIAGYTLAAGVGLMRIYNSRHWMADVLAGAGIGILSTSAAYWTYPTLNRWATHHGCRLTATATSLTLNF